MHFVIDIIGILAKVKYVCLREYQALNNKCFEFLVLANTLHEYTTNILFALLCKEFEIMQ